MVWLCRRDRDWETHVGENSRIDPKTSGPWHACSVQSPFLGWDCEWDGLDSHNEVMLVTKVNEFCRCSEGPKSLKLIKKEMVLDGLTESDKPLERTVLCPEQEIWGMRGQEQWRGHGPLSYNQELNSAPTTCAPSRT